MTRFQPPAWMVGEGQQRLVLFLNHVLLQEKQAQSRLLRQKNRVAHIRWGLFAIDLIVTPAGLLDLALPFSKPDLVLSVAAESPMVMFQAVLAGKAPPVKIEGDVQFAAEVGWLADNLRWDAEEDLSRLIGDVPAHALAGAGRRLAAGLKEFLVQKTPSTPTVASPGVALPSTPESSKPRPAPGASGGERTSEFPATASKLSSYNDNDSSSSNKSGSIDIVDMSLAPEPGKPA